MAEIFSLHDRAKKTVLESDKELRLAGTIFRVLFCGHDRRGIEIASRALARAFLTEGFYARFDEPLEETPSCPTVYVRLGREIITESGFHRPPGLVVSGDPLPDEIERLLPGCGEGCLLLVDSAEEPGELKARLGFAGTVLKLPVSVPSQPEPWFIGASCAGGAARLLGNISWTSLESALRNELVVCDGPVVHRNLARALEAFDRLAPWAGSVQAVEEEVEEEGGGGMS